MVRQDDDWIGRHDVPDASKVHDERLETFVRDVAIHGLALAIRYQKALEHRPRRKRLESKVAKGEIDVLRRPRKQRDELPIEVEADIPES